MARLTRDQIASSGRFPEAEVHVPEWGGDVLLRGLSVGQREQIVKEHSDEEGMRLPSFSAALVAACLYEPGPFTIDEVREFPVRVTERFLDAIFPLNNDVPVEVLDDAGKPAVDPATGLPVVVSAGEAAAATFPADEQ